MSSTSDDGLRRKLAAVLPQNKSFGIHHLSTPPSKCDPLYAAPPKERADRTYCENHFLTVTIDTPSPSSTKLLIIGIEVLVFTTAFSTTIFVSKADSTGYLNLLQLSKGTPSPIREICAAFVSHLVATRKRKGIQLVVSLFARAQSQYLFPGSVDNSGKHVLDDRGLIKWWCRVLNPLLGRSAGVVEDVKGYLVIPGLDAYETKAFVPRTSAPSKWSLTHPLREISHYTREYDWVPARCLIPHFPDDPKSRFRDELDEEAARSAGMRDSGSWKSVKDLETFWELMAYRQECSSGRMTGFIWLVFNDSAPTKTGQDANPSTPSASFQGDSKQFRGPAEPQTPQKHKDRRSPDIRAATPRKLFTSNDHKKDDDKAQTRRKRREKKRRKLRGLVKVRKPRIKTEHRNHLQDRPISTAYYYWPQQGRGEHLVSETDYKRIVELLLHLDFATVEKAATSTKRWISEAGMRRTWGWDVVGVQEPPARVNDSAVNSTGVTNDLAALVKRKRPAEGSDGEVKVLSAGLVKRKPKVDEEPPSTMGDAPGEKVNVLSSNLIRKAPKS